eukprot:Blabericola_migrator_1__2930@NODE_1842_length_3692_cov_92_376276_g1179_i0_p1_GENE_NODE_1842_length_3692_cov_92_376276_g1179_i0NODE_1842_length_3692_cov_92_376276_g1179_i0_p1_ORF_typecomplete_len1169_score257_63SAC3_GANP/PF03399_16/9_1e53_NODE_1842_length_3692_cov_92_376276_g1179_i01683674
MKPCTPADRDRLHDPQGKDVPPPELLRQATHPLLSYGDSRTEAIFANVQSPEYILSKPDDGTAMVGSLNGMCSTEEMLDKQRTCTANDLERLNVTQGSCGSGADVRYINKHLAVKSFQRSDASKVFLPADTRPILWCRRTVHNVLMLQIEADCAKLPWLFRRDTPYRFLDVYNFVRDRLRSVWTDLTVQHCECHRGTIECLEVSSRFLILAEELLCEDHEFDAVQNGSLLSTCLEKLMACYHAVRRFQSSPEQAKFREGLEGNGTLANNLNPQEKSALVSTLIWESPYEVEFWSYRLLLCLSHGERTSSSVSNVLTRVPKSFLTHPMVKLALGSISAFKEGNVLRYFKYQDKAPYLMALLMSKFGNLLRMRFLYIVSGGSRAQSNLPYPLFLQLFNFKDEPSAVVDEFCEKNDIQIILNDTTGKPEQVSVSNVCVSLDDLRPRKLRFKRFKSEQLSRKFESLKVSRKQLLDPSLDISAQAPPHIGNDTAVKTKLSADSGQPPKAVLKRSSINKEKQRTPLIFKQSNTLLAHTLGGHHTPIHTPETSPQKQRVEPLFVLGSLVQSPSMMVTEESPQVKPSPTFTPDTMRLAQPFGNLVGGDGIRNKENEETPVAEVPRFGLEEIPVSGLSNASPSSNQPVSPPNARPPKRKQAEVNTKRQPLRTSEAGGDDTQSDIAEELTKKTRRAADFVGEETVRPLAMAWSLPTVPPVCPLATSEVQIAERLSRYRATLGMDLEAVVPGALASQVIESLMRCKDTAPLFNDFNDTSVDWVINAMGIVKAPLNMLKLTTTECKLWDWNLCLCDPSTGSNDMSILRVCLEALLMGVSLPHRLKHTKDAQALETGVLATWTQNRCVCVEEGPGFLYTQWIKKWRLRDEAAIGLLCVSSPGLSEALDRRYKIRSRNKMVFMWTMKTPVSLQRSSETGDKKYRLCAGMVSALQNELTEYIEALSKCDRFIEGTAIFLVHLDVVVASALPSDLSNKLVFIEKMNLRLSQRVHKIIKEKLESPSSQKLQPAVIRYLERSKSVFEQTQEPFVFVCAISMRDCVAETPTNLNSARAIDRDSDDVCEDSSSKRWVSWPDGSGVPSPGDATCASTRATRLLKTDLSMWQLVPTGLSLAFNAITTGMHRTLTHYMKEERKFKILKELPLRIFWSKRVTECLPFVLINL